MMGKCDCCSMPTRRNAILCASCAEEAIQAEEIRYYVHQACTYTEYQEAIRQIEAQASYEGRHDS